MYTSTSQINKTYMFYASINITIEVTSIRIILQT